MNNTRMRTLWLGRGLLLVIIAAILFIVWQVFLKRPFVTVVVPEGASKVELDSTSSNKTTEVTKTGKVRLNIGKYNVTYYKDKAAVGFASASVKPGFSQSIKGETSTPVSNLETVLHQHADMMAPLKGGYLYVDNVTRGIYYVDKNGMVDLNKKFLLLQVDPTDSAFSGTYSTVVSLDETKDGSVLVTTTTAVFLVKSATDIQPLPTSDQDFLNYTAASYDATTNRLFVLSSFKRQVFYFDASKPEERPKELTSAPLDVNRIVAGGGKVAVYFDDVPSTDSKVLDEYAKNRQLTPIILDATDGKKTRTLNERPITQLAISPDGKYLAYKKKFATTMTVQEIGGGGSFTIPASDTNTMAWWGDGLYLARGNSLWSVSPAQDKKQLSLVSAVGDPVIRMISVNDELYATTATSFIYKVVAGDQDTSENMGNLLQKLTLSTGSYFIAFASFDTSAQVTIETAGDYSQGFDDASMAASKAAQYQQGLSALGQYAKNANVSITQKDTAITTPFTSVGEVSDSGTYAGE